MTNRLTAVFFDRIVVPLVFVAGFTLAIGLLIGESARDCLRGLNRPGA